MVGITTNFVDAVIEITIPSLRSLVVSQYGDRAEAEWPAIDGWLTDHGVTAIIASNGDIYFMPGMFHDMSDLETGEVALIYGYNS